MTYRGISSSAHRWASDHLQIDSSRLSTSRRKQATLRSDNALKANTLKYTPEQFSQAPRLPRLDGDGCIKRISPLGDYSWVLDDTTRRPES